MAKRDDEVGLLELITGAMSLAGKTSRYSSGLVRRLFDDDKEPAKERLSSKLLQETGAYVKELREVAGVTREDLANALDLSDDSYVSAIESGTATLSFDLILRLASVLARHDPVPFVFKLLRTYNPELWDELSDWGVTGISDQYERERRFVNLLRQHDEARELSHEAFDRVLMFVDAALIMALEFAKKNAAQAEMKEARDAPKKSGKSKAQDSEVKKKASRSASGKRTSK